MDAGAWGPYAVALSAVLVAIIQTRARSVERRRTRTARSRAERLKIEHTERVEFIEGWRGLVDASRAQARDMVELVAGVRAELAQCEADRRQFVLDVAQVVATLERHEAVLAGRIPPPK